MKLIGYLRVSTEEQATGGQSLRAQRERLEAWARLYEHELVEVLEDPGASGKSLEGRPGLAEALRRLEAGAADGLLVAKLDRLTRSVRDLGELLERVFARACLVSVAEQIDTSTAAGRLVVHVLGAVAQWERETIAERTREVLRSMKARGLRTGSVPHGRRLGLDGSTLELDADELEAALLARKLRRRGASLRAIGLELWRAGHYSRRGGPWDTVAGPPPPWNPKSVRALLENGPQAKQAAQG